MNLKHFETLSCVLAYVLDELVQTLQDDLRETQEHDDHPFHESVAAARAALGRTA